MGVTAPSKAGGQCDQGGMMTEDKSREEIFQERIGWARSWLKGYIQDRDGQWRHAYHEAGSNDDHRGRMALAQLLMNGEAPKEILQLLAQAIVPNDPDFPELGNPIFDEYAPSTVKVPPQGLTRRLDFTKKRTKARVPDVYRDGQVLPAVARRLADGMSKKKAFEEVAAELGMTPGAVKGRWRRYPQLAKWLEAGARDHARQNG